MFTFSRISDGLRQLFFPNNCLICGRSLVTGEDCICLMCMAALPRTGFEKWRDNPTEKRFWGKVDVYSAFSAYYYRKGQPLSHMIHDFKYHNNRKIALYLGRQIGAMINKTQMSADYDCIVPVPLHSKKMLIRGYNQCTLLAQGASEVCGLPIDESILVRAKHSVSQTKKNQETRITSLKDTFVITPEAERRVGLRVLLLDDVLTTGATLESCCNALSIIPNVRIGIVTLGIANSD